MVNYIFDKCRINIFVNVSKQKELYFIFISDDKSFFNYPLLIVNH